jgi:hypothetical protein
VRGAGFVGRRERYLRVAGKENNRRYLAAGACVLRGNSELFSNNIAVIMLLLNLLLIIRFGSD